MQLSLSVRIVEAPCKTRLHMPLEQILDVAVSSGYPAICMRASAVGVQSSAAELAAARRQIESAGLAVSMVTADFDVPLNNDQGPNSLRDIGPSLDVAAELGSDLVDTASDLDSSSVQVSYNRRVRDSLILKSTLGIERENLSNGRNRDGIFFRLGLDYLF